MRHYGIIPKDRGFAILVTSDCLRGRPRYDVRRWFETRPGDADTLRPSRSGVSLLPLPLPTLRAALEEAEAYPPVSFRPKTSRHGVPLPEALHGTLSDASTEETPAPIPLS